MSTASPVLDAEYEPPTATDAPITGIDLPPQPRGHKRRRRIIAVVALVGVAGAAVGAWAATRGATPAAAFTVTTQQVKVTTGTIKVTVSASGTIQPAQEANLNFSVSGTVGAVNVASGQNVTQGQTLATVNSTALQYQVAAAQSTVSADQSKLSSDTAAGATTSQLYSDQAALTSAQLQLSTAQTNLANAALTSTINGTVASVNLSVGQQVSAGGSSASSPSASAGSATGGNTGGNTGGASSATATQSTSSASSSTSAQVVVVSTSSFTVSTTVDDTQVGQVKSGDQAVITPTGSATPVYGTVSSVGLIATSTSGVAAFPVTIAITGTPSGLFAGATASVSIVTQQLNNATEVPTAAITYSNGQASVTAVQNGKQVTQPVTTGASASGQTQIISGVTVGQTVIEKVVKFNTSGAPGSILGGAGQTAGTRGGGAGGGFGGGGGGGGGGGARTGTGTGG